MACHLGNLSSNFIFHTDHVLGQSIDSVTTTLVARDLVRQQQKKVISGNKPLHEADRLPIEQPPHAFSPPHHVLPDHRAILGMSMPLLSSQRRPLPCLRAAWPHGSGEGHPCGVCMSTAFITQRDCSIWTQSRQPARLGILELGGLLSIPVIIGSALMEGRWLIVGEMRSVFVEMDSN